MTATQIAQMSRTEKLQTMQALWADLSQSETDVQSPAWHEVALRETAARVSAGQERITDWQLAKQELRKRFE